MKLDTNPAELDKAELDAAELDRADPPCPHFGPCGGCQLQHLAYAAQLRRKAAQLRALLATTGLPMPELQLHASPPLAYRNRIRLTLGEVEGQLRAGYIRNASEPAGGGQQPATGEGQPATFLPITQCPIAAPILWRAAEAFLALVNEDAATWLRSPHYAPDQLEIFTAPDESSLQLTLFLRTAAAGKKNKQVPGQLTAGFTALCEALRGRIPELTGAGIALLPPASSQRSRRAEQPRPGPAWGSLGLSYSVPLFESTSNERFAYEEQSTGDEERPTNNQQLATYWVPRAAFFQVNRFLIAELVRVVIANRSGALAWDLYAGVGLFSRALAARFAHVTAVEAAEPAASALAALPKQPGLVNPRAVQATTLDFLRTAVVERDRPDLIVLDPPRSGAGREVCALLGRIAAPSLVYVSCSPETLPADLTTLAAAGYTLAELHLFDLFPQTTHIETVAVLTRASNAVLTRTQP